MDMTPSSVLDGAGADVEALELAEVVASAEVVGSAEAEELELELVGAASVEEAGAEEDEEEEPPSPPLQKLS